MAEIKKAKERVNFGKINLADESPDLLDIQLSTFKEFFQIETTTDNRSKEGLYQVFMENFPISDTRNIFVLEFLDYFIDHSALQHGGVRREGPHLLCSTQS
jgi:DNA-directed RNA polymerase subunit beta